MFFEKPLFCIFPVQFSTSVYSSLTVKVPFISWAERFCLLEAFLFCQNVKGLVILMKRMAEIQLL